MLHALYDLAAGFTVCINPLQNGFYTVAVDCLRGIYHRWIRDFDRVGNGGVIPAVSPLLDMVTSELYG